jgi:hypothetical protein
MSEPAKLTGRVIAGAVMSGLNALLPLYSLFAPGLLFGLAFVMPWCRLGGVSRRLTGVTVALAPVGYLVAGLCYCTNEHCWWAALAGTETMLIPVILFGPMPIRAGAVAGCLVGGLLGAAFIELRLCLHSFSWIIPGVVAGVAVWQIGVALVMELVRRRVTVMLAEEWVRK